MGHLSHLLALLGASSSLAAGPPHIVMILTDDLGWNSMYNNPRTISPFIDNLAANEGLKMTSHYVYKYCSPTRGAFLTGRYPYHLPNTRANLIPWSLPDGTPLGYQMLPKTLAKAGYRSVHIGKWHQGFYTNAYTPVGRGFNYSFGFLEGGEDHLTSATFNGKDKCKPNGFDLSYGWDNGTTVRGAFGKNGTYTGYLFGWEAVDVVRSHAKQGEFEGQPLFLYLALHNTHAPVEAPQRFIDMYNYSDPLENKFNAQVTFVDELVKNVTQELKKNGMWDNTLFVWSTDNGAPVQVAGSNHPLRGGKGHNWEGGCRVPTFVSGGVLPTSQRGKTTDGMAHVLDWYATFAGLAGLPAKAPADGEAPAASLDLWPWLSGAAESSPRNMTVYDHRLYTADNASMATGALRLGDLKVIVGPETEASWYGLFSPNNTKKPDLSASACSIEAPCLFDVKNDPSEHVDLAKSRPDDLKRLLDAFHKLADEYHPPKDNPPREVEAYCGAMHANQGCVTPWR